MTRRLVALLPGMMLCAGIAAVSYSAELAERHVFAHPYVEALVLAILLGMIARSLWQPTERWQAGIAFSAKQLLEFAVMLLGASISFAEIGAAGPALLGTIAVLVAVTLGLSYAIARLLGLSKRLSVLIACGNSICGNSAIAAVAPVIGADGDEIASSISFTAILGVIVVLGLPLLIPLLQLTATQYGIIAGLTVYAVPQVLAATVPAGLLSTQVGTLVKLMRVLMLGPVVLGLSLLVARRTGSRSASTGFFRLVPWFILGFLALAAIRSSGLIPRDVVSPVMTITGFLTVISMAALGLGVDVRVLAGVGSRVTAAVTLSLLFLLGLSLGVARWFG